MSARDLELAMAVSERVANGLNVLANAGRRAGNVIIETSWTAATITDDGVVVAMEIELEDITTPIAFQVVAEHLKPVA